MLLKKTLAILALSAGGALAQYRASLQGTVTDATGSIVPDAKITLTSTETNTTKTATTSNTGVYTISNLAPGTYTLTVEKTGFVKQEISGVAIVSEQAQGRDIQLQVGAPDRADGHGKCVGKPRAGYGKRDDFEHAIKPTGAVAAYIWTRPLHGGATRVWNIW